MILAEAVLPGATLKNEAGNVVYGVESVRIDRKTRVQFDLDGEHTQERGHVSLLVRFVADGGTDIRRFDLGQYVPLENADGSTDPLV